MSTRGLHGANGACRCDLWCHDLFSERTLAYMQQLIPQDFPHKAIANAQHHVFLDQPPEFVAAVKEITQQF